MIKIDSALGEPWEELGRVIKNSGEQDSSGLRRYLADCLTGNDKAGFCRITPVSDEEFLRLRKSFY